MRRATTAETEPTRTIGQSPWGSGGKTHRNRAPRTSDLSKGISRPKKKIQDFGPYLHPATHWLPTIANPFSDRQVGIQETI